MPPSMFNKTPQEMMESVVFMAAIGAALLGVILWLGGSRFSKTTIPLILFSIGSRVGLFLPDYFGWHLDGWATALAAGLILGASGVVLHRYWVGVGLGLVMAGWSGLVIWHYFSNVFVFAWKLPDVPLDSLQMVTSLSDLYRVLHLREYVMQYWNAMPIEVRGRLPYSSAAAMVAGMSLTLLRPRLTMVLFYSMTGVTLIALAGLYYMSTGSSWAARIPRQPGMQVLLIAAMTVMGMLVQWQTKAIPPAPQNEDSTEPQRSGKSSGSRR